MAILCSKCGKAMILLDAQTQKWYCYADNELYYANIMDLIDTDVHADILTLFHNNATLSESCQQIAIRLQRNLSDVQLGLDDLVKSGLLQKVAGLYSYRPNMDKAVQDAISRSLRMP